MSQDTLLNVVQLKLDRLLGSPSISACAIGLGVVYVVYSVFWIKRNAPPSLLQIPVLGDLPFILLGVQTSQWMKARIAKYGPIYTAWFLGQRITVVHGPEATFKILQAEGTLVHSDWPSSTKTALGPHSVTVTTGERHAYMRKVLNPAFRASVLLKSLPLIVKLAQDFCEQCATKRIISGYDVSRDFPFKVMMIALLGYTEEELDDKLQASLTESLKIWLRGLFSLPLNLPGFAYPKMLKERQALIDKMKQHARNLLERQESNLTSEACGENLVRVKDDEGKGFDLNELGDILLNLVFAGHETTASVALTLLRELPRHPEVMAQLRAEQDKVRAKHGDEFTAEAVADMDYAEAVTKEALRYRIIVPFVFRKAVKAFQLGPYTIPKGQKLLVDLKTVIEGDSRWAGADGEAAPDKFFPQRWMTDDGRSVGGFIPFGSGVRMCLGWRLTMLELKVLLAVWARGYEWRQVDPNEWNPNGQSRKPGGMKIKFACLGGLTTTKE